jgi:nitrite reductase (NADH) small subunit
MSQWKSICKFEEIPVLGARRVSRANGGEVAVFRNADDKVFALLDRCPHKGGPLSQGIVFGESVACPLHNWTIDLADGCAKRRTSVVRRSSASRSRTARCCSISTS